MSLEQTVEADEREANQDIESVQKQQRPSSLTCGQKAGELSSARHEGRASYKPMTRALTTTSHRSSKVADNPVTPCGRPGEWR